MSNTDFDPKKKRVMIALVLTILVVAAAFAYFLHNVYETQTQKTLPILSVNQTKQNQTFSTPSLKLNATNNSSKYKPFDFSGSLFGQKIPDKEQIYLVQNIMKNVDLKCYAVGFYTGLTNATFYDDRSMMEHIRKYISGASPYDFVRNKYVRDYLEHFCIHLDSSRQLPANYTGGIGVTMEQQMAKWHANQTSQNLGINWNRSSTDIAHPKILVGNSA